MKNGAVMSFDSTQEDSAESIPSVEVQPDEDNGEGFDSSFAGGGTKSGNRGLVILGGLILIGAVSVWFVYFRGGPQSAQAGMAPSDGGSQIKQFLDSGNINMMKQTLKETEKIVKQFRAYPGKTQVPLESLHTNPFRELEPKANEPTAANSRDAERAGFTRLWVSDRSLFGPGRGEHRLPRGVDATRGARRADRAHPHRADGHRAVVPEPGASREDRRRRRRDEQGPSRLRARRRLEGRRVPRVRATNSRTRRHA